MDKQKEMIEEMRIQRKLEMTKDISNGISGVLAYDIQKLAEHLISLNYQKIGKDSVSTSKEKVFDILNKFEFFQGQRAGRELWNDKPKEVQDQDIADFVKGINYIRTYLQDNIVLSREEYAELTQKIYDDIFAILKIKLWLYGDDAMTKNLNGLSKQKILDFTKKWGIEDNHLNEKDYSHIDHLQAHDKQIKEQERKETAEKFAKEFDKLLTKKLRSKREFICFGVKWYIEENTLYNTIYEVNKELAKQFGVEIKE